MTLPPRINRKTGKADAGKRSPAHRASQAERNHMAWVAEQGCVVCAMPCQVHHLTEAGHGRISKDNFLVLGLCESHHTGRWGIHSLSRIKFAEMYDVDVAHRAFALRARSPYWTGE